MDREGSKTRLEGQGMRLAESVERLGGERRRLVGRGMRSAGELALFEN